MAGVCSRTLCRCCSVCKLCADGVILATVLIASAVSFQDFTDDTCFVSIGASCTDSFKIILVYTYVLLMFLPWLAAICCKLCRVAPLFQCMYTQLRHGGRASRAWARVMRRIEPGFDAEAYVQDSSKRTVGARFQLYRLGLAGANTREQLREYFKAVQDKCQPVDVYISNYTIEPQPKGEHAISTRDILQAFSEFDDTRTLDSFPRYATLDQDNSDAKNRMTSLSKASTAIVVVSTDLLRAIASRSHRDPDEPAADSAHPALVEWIVILELLRRADTPMKVVIPVAADAGCLNADTIREFVASEVTPCVRCELSVLQASQQLLETTRSESIKLWEFQTTIAGALTSIFGADKCWSDLGDSYPETSTLSTAREVAMRVASALPGQTANTSYSNDVLLSIRSSRRPTVARMCPGSNQQVC